MIDTEGVELASVYAAKREAVRLMAGLLADKHEEFWDAQMLKVIVTDESSLILFVLDLSAVEAPVLRGHGKS